MQWRMEAGRGRTARIASPIQLRHADRPPGRRPESQALQMHLCGFFAARALAALLLTTGALMVPGALAQSGSGSGADQGSTSGGPVRLRQPQQAQPQDRQDRQGQSTRQEAAGADVRPDEADGERLPRYRPGEFELYMQKVTNDSTLRRFGADLVLDAGPGRSLPQETEPQVPPDYRVAPGDELLVTIWGSVDADLRLIVDRTGRISIPRIGSVTVSGLPIVEVSGAIERQARKVFKNFELSVSIGQLRNVRLFVTGFAVRPGAYTVSSLATLSSVLFNRAGGPSGSGSFRDIELRRGGRTVAKLDLYDLMLFGRRDADQLVQADDVIHIGPVGAQVALIGSINKPAIFEVKAGEGVGDLLRMAGGFSAVADRSRLAVERLGERNESRIRELSLPREVSASLGAGDVVRAFSAVDAVLPQEHQNKRVRIEGEVRRPGDYILPPNSSVSSMIQAAGGLTPAAYLFGTDFSRESVRLTQQTNYERALRDLELQISKKASSTSTRTTEEAAAASQKQVATERLLQRLRETRPNGRIVLQLQPDAKELPDLTLEDGDRLHVPATPTTVGVFGSVFNAGSYLYLGRRSVDDYLKLAGSPTRTADTKSVFVVRANGSVVSALQANSGIWLFGSDKFAALPVLPGDTVFVPEELDRQTFLQIAKDWTQILYQFGLGAAGIKAILP